jgi:hypothetical protein
MWVLAVNRQWAVDGGGAVLVGWVVIGVVGLLTVCKRTNDDDVVVVVVIHLRGMVLRAWRAPVVVFRGRSVCWAVVVVSRLGLFAVVEVPLRGMC